MRGDTDMLNGVTVLLRWMQGRIVLIAQELLLASCKYHLSQFLQVDANDQVEAC